MVPFEDTVSALEVHSHNTSGLGLIVINMVKKCAGAAVCKQKFYKMSLSNF